MECIATETHVYNYDKYNRDTMSAGAFRMRVISAGLSATHYTKEIKSHYGDNGEFVTETVTFKAFA